MAFKKVYIPIKPFLNHENFDIVYEDGDKFCSVSCSWETEHDKVELTGRTGGRIARIKPDNLSLQYDIQCDRWTYHLHTYTIEKHYFYEGMKWQIFGCASTGHCHAENEDTKKNDMHIATVKNFRGGKDKYLEVSVKDLSHLRPAAAAAVAMIYKESWKGKSEGEPDEKLGYITRLKKFMGSHYYTYEQVKEREAQS